MLSSSTEMPWRRRSAMSSEVRFEFRPEVKHGKSEISTPHTLCYINKFNSETVSTSLYSSFSSLTNNYYSSLLCQMNISPCGVKLNTFETSMQKRVNITYTGISPNSIFGLCYQHQVLKLIHPGTVWILLPYQITWVNEP